MYYKDLTPYEYYLPFRLANVFNVGWLDKNTDFETGNPPNELLGKLRKILINEGVFEGRVNQIRGVHPCNLCDAHEFDNPFIGSCELWIPGQEVRTYFAAPSLIIHYIFEHNYCPPKIFVDSVMKLDLKTKFNGQKLYDDLLVSRGNSSGN